MLPTTARPLATRALRLAAATTGALLAGLGLAGPAQAAASSTTVAPAGHTFQATLAAGTTADFTVGAVTVACTQSSTTGQVPAAPDNANTAGPVASPLSPPVFTNGSGACATNVVLTTATTTTNSTNGPWSVSIQYDQAGSSATLGIPQAGVLTQISGLASCQVTVAPNGPASVAGALVPATASSPPLLDFSAGVAVPITVTGGLFCPTSATSATFSAVYEITNTTDAAQPITVGP